MRITRLVAAGAIMITGMSPAMGIAQERQGATAPATVPEAVTTVGIATIGAGIGLAAAVVGEGVGGQLAPG